MAEHKTEATPNPEWDDDFARSLIGKYLLVGITHLDSAGETIDLEQKHGEIVQVSQHVGIVMKEASGELYALPPVLKWLEPASSGSYELHESGDIVHDPDYLCRVRSRAKEHQGN